MTDSLIVATAGTGVARTSHYVTPTGASAPIQTLLLEPQRTNVCIRSEEFETWTQTVCVVTANASVAPDGTTTADLITPSADTNGRVRRNVTFTGDAEKCIAVYLKAGTSTRSRFTLRDTTAATDRVGIRISWSAGVPTPAAFSGSGTIYPVEALANGWYRILVSAVGVIAANNNEVAIFADDSAGTGTVYAWGAQAENAIVPSSYIKTEGTTVTRNADSLYFPFTAPPQAMTVYVRGANREAYSAAGLAATAKRVLHIGTSDVAVDPRFSVYGDGAGAALCLYDDGLSGVRTSSVSTGGAALNDIVEARAVLSAAGAVLAAVSINSAAELVGVLSASSTLPTAFADTRLYLTGSLSATNTMFAYTHVIVAAGEQTMETMRSLAGVA